jgi:hypothetical protein
VLSIREILFTVVVFVVVWLAFRWLLRAQELRANRGVTAKSSTGVKNAAEDLIACPFCGVYRMLNTGNCDRPDCQRT